MGETFYSVLGVDADAPQSRIRAAYRERVKEHHPDRNDAPDAPRTFKRLTTARDVLLDPDDRATYDELGHRTYVTRHVESCVWEPADGTGAATTTTAHSAADRVTEVGGWREHATTDGRTGSGTRPAGTAATRTGSRAGGQHQPWQRAPDAYRSSYLDEDRRSSWQSLRRGVQKLGSWIVLHAIVLVSAVLTGWLLVGSIGTDPAVSAAAGLLLVLLIGTVLIASVLHVLVELY